MAEQMRTRPVARVVALACCASFGGLVACSSTNSATPDANGSDPSVDASITCDKDPRGLKFGPNVTRKGENGGLSFVIAGAYYNTPGAVYMAGEDDPPAVTGNIWILKVLDATGQPVKDAVLTFPLQGLGQSDPWMPDHHHGALHAEAVNNNDGTYTIAPLYFFQGGIWSTYINAQVGSVTDHTTFTFCVGG